MYMRLRLWYFKKIPKSHGGFPTVSSLSFDSHLSASEIWKKKGFIIVQLHTVSVATL